MVDPILSLAVAIAEGRKTYAVFLGSGVSKAAGIPTGTDIFRDSIKRIYKLKEEKEAKDNEIRDWFEKSEFKDFTYSKILESICPSPEERRQFLEGYFVGKNPTDTHRDIANMVKNGLLRIIITTNFDRLMENALDAVEVKYDVVSSPAELKARKPREHSSCRILKLHGDYQSGEIKNTEQELASLDSSIESEFQEILDRYGIVVMGYSGQDEGVMKCLEKRNSKYTLYWLKKGEIDERVNRLLMQGKIIERENSDKFLNELTKKIEIFSLYETGDTPEYLMHLTKQFIKENDEVGIGEEVKKHLNIIRKNWQEIYEKIQNEIKDEKIKDYLKIAQDGVKALEIHTDKILGMGLVLVEYDKKDYFGRILRVFQEIYDLTNKASINWFDSLTDIPFAVIHNIFYTLGAFALRAERFNILKDLLSIGITDRKIRRYENVLIERSILFPKSIGGDTVKSFMFLKSTIGYKEFLNEYFPLEEDFLSALCEFNYLLNMYVRIKGKELQDTDGNYLIVPTFLTFYPNRVQGFTMRLKKNSEFLKAISETICGEKVETFIEKYPSRCENINKYPHIQVVNSRLDPNLFIESSSTGVLS